VYFAVVKSQRESLGLIKLRSPRTFRDHLSSVKEAALPKAARFDTV